MTIHACVPWVKGVGPQCGLVSTSGVTKQPLGVNEAPLLRRPGSPVPNSPFLQNQESSVPVISYSKGSQQVPGVSLTAFPSSPLDFFNHSAVAATISVPTLHSVPLAGALPSPSGWTTTAPGSLLQGEGAALSCALPPLLCRTSSLPP